MFLRITLALLALFVLALGALTAFLHQHLQTPEFTQQALAKISQAAGTQISAEGMEVSIFRGITLQAVRVANPGDLPGDFLRAEAMVLQYRLLPLLSRRVEIDELTLESPRVELFQTQQGQWNFQLFRNSQASGKPAAAQIPSNGFDILLSLFRIRNAEATLRDRKGVLLTRLEGLDLTASASVGRQGQLESQGSLQLETVQLGENLKVTELSAQLLIDSRQVRIEALQGRLAEGQLSAHGLFQIQPKFGYRLEIELAEAALEKLSGAAQVSPPLTGTLTFKATVEGTAGRETLQGTGDVYIRDGVVAQFPSQDKITEMLGVPELRQIKFSSCSSDLILADNRLSTDNLKLVSDLVRLSGQGTVSLEDDSIDHQLTLLLKDEMVERLPSPVRKAFSQPDEERFRGTPFRVWGPYEDPQTDLRERLARAALEGLVDDGLKGLRDLFRK